MSLRAAVEKACGDMVNLSVRLDPANGAVLRKIASNLRRGLREEYGAPDEPEPALSPCSDPWTQRALEPEVGWAAPPTYADGRLIAVNDLVTYPDPYRRPGTVTTSRIRTIQAYLAADGIVVTTGVQTWHHIGLILTGKGMTLLARGRR